MRLLQILLLLVLCWGITIYDQLINISNTIMITSILTAIIIISILFYKGRIKIKIARSTKKMLLLIYSPYLVYLWLDLFNSFNQPFEAKNAFIQFVFFIPLVISIFMLYDIYTNKLNKGNYLFEPYVWFACCFCFAGFVAWLLVILNIVNFADFYFNEGMLRKDSEGIGGKNLYSMPFYLGLVLTGERSFELFGLTVLRSSGLSPEPAMASLFIQPAIALLPFILYKKKIWFSRIIYSIFILFTIITFSVAGWLALMLLIILKLVKGRKGYKEYAIIMFMFIFIAVIVTASIMSPGDNLIIHKFTGHSMMGTASIFMSMWRVDNYKEIIILTQSLFLYFHFAIIAIVGVHYFISNNKNYNVGILLIVFMILVQKSPLHAITYPFYHFIIISSLLISNDYNLAGRSRCENEAKIKL